VLIVSIVMSMLYVLHACVRCVAASSDIDKLSYTNNNSLLMMFELLVCLVAFVFAIRVVARSR
jgi:hypothetical protein